jgi:hypothetical protein
MKLWAKATSLPAVMAKFTRLNTASPCVSGCHSSQLRLYASAPSYFIGGKTSKITKSVEWCFRISSLLLSLVAAAHSSSMARTSSSAVVIVGSEGGCPAKHDGRLRLTTQSLPQFPVPASSLVIALEKGRSAELWRNVGHLNHCTSMLKLRGLFCQGYRIAYRHKP